MVQLYLEYKLNSIHIMEIQLTDSNFKEEVLDYKGLTLVDFWAPWCGPCRMLAPTIEEVAKEMEGKAKIGKMDVDENTQYPQEYGVMSIPTVILFKDGEVVETLIGLQPKDALVKSIEAHL